MGNITETPLWEESVFQVETTTPLLGGNPEINSNGTATAGYLNVAQQQLANRTLYLKDTIENTDIDVGGLSDRVQDVEVSLTQHIGSRGAAHSNATQTEAGFMSAADKTKLNGVETGAQVNTVTSVAGRGGVVVLTKADVGLSNVDNTADTAKPVSTAQQTALDLKANLASPSLTGTPTTPTATAGTNTTQIASTAFVTAGLALKANLASPSLTGTPTAPTATAGTNTTQLATTAFVATAVATGSVATNLGNTPGASTVVVTSSTGTSTTLSAATTSLAGVLTAADKTKLDSLTPATTQPILQIQDQKSQGVNGGTTVSTTWTNRNLTTVVINQISGASLSSDVVTLPAGTYEIESTSPFYGDVGLFRTRLYNVSDATAIMYGTSARTVAGDGTTIIPLTGIFTLAATKNVSIQYYTSNAVSLGLGQTSNIGGIIETFTDLKLRKLS